MTPQDAVSHSQHNAHVVVTGNHTVSQAVSVALARLGDFGPLVPGDGPIDLITPDARRRPLLRSAVLEVRRAMVFPYPDVTILDRSESREAASERRVWQAVPAPVGTERFNEILVPGWWSRTSRRCVVTTVPRNATAPRLSPMLVLAGLAHPRQRLAARIHRHRIALAAELAAPWRINLCVLVASRPPFRIVAATRDLIAAELVWLALAGGDEADQNVVPWEDPAVQRATQLGMGVLGPHQVSVSALDEVIGSALSDQLASRLGVALST